MDLEPSFAPPPLKAKRKSATKVVNGGWGLKANGLKHVKHATSKRIICCKKKYYTLTHTNSTAETKW